MKKINILIATIVLVLITYFGLLLTLKHFIRDRVDFKSNDIAYFDQYAENDITYYFEGNITFREDYKEKFKVKYNFLKDLVVINTKNNNDSVYDRVEFRFISHTAYSKYIHFIIEQKQTKKQFNFYVYSNGHIKINKINNDGKIIPPPIKFIVKSYYKE